MKKEKSRIVLLCSTCGQELECSPGMVQYVLAGKGLCVRCDNAGRVGHFERRGQS